MAETDVQKIPAGRELDLLVAEEVLEQFYTHGDEPPKYSAEMAEAWIVAEKVKLLFGEEAQFAVTYLGPRGQWMWLCAWTTDDIASFERDEISLCHAGGDTAAIAICRAALKGTREKAVD